MTEPLDAIVAIHNAFRRDMAQIDSAALDLAKGGSDITKTFDRFRFFNEVLVWHATGEEIAIFPLIESVAPLVAEAYERDHRGLDSAFNALTKAVNSNDRLSAARATAAFKFHLDIHLRKEDVHLYRIMRERVSIPDQSKALGIMSKSVPQDRFPELIVWLLPLLDHNDRENMTRIWRTVMPPETFKNIKMMIRQSIGSDWAELVKRIPDLE
jgi:hemerythrin-like domain-containing protein